MNLVATLDAGEAARRIWDVVVIGAGPAGCMAARELARSGCRVLLLEARRFPRSKVCGGCLNQHAVALLESRGLGHLVPQTGATRLHEFRIQLPDWRPAFQLPSGWSVTRATLDAHLLEATLQAGVQFLDLALARVDPTVLPDCRIVQVDHPQGAFEVSARVVICAEGLARSASRQARLEASVAADAFLGAGITVPAAEIPAALLAASPAGTITMAVGQGGYVGIAQAETGQYSLGAALRPALIRDHGSLGRAIEEVLATSGLPGSVGLGQLPWQGTPLLQTGRNQLSLQRVFLVGDSASYVEPFTGEGMAWAIEGGISVAPIARAGVMQWNDALCTDWMRVYRKRIRRSQWICRGLLQALHRPGVGRFAAAMFRLFPKAADRMIAAINRPVRSPGIES